MQHWEVVISKNTEKDLRKAPKEIVEIASQLRIDLEHEGPLPKWWLIKHVKGKKNLFSVRLKREYRAIYEVVSPTIIIMRIAHRKDIYKYAY